MIKAGNRNVRKQEPRLGEAQRPATRETRPIPEAGPLAQPKSLEQAGLPAEQIGQAIPSDNPQTPEKIALGQKLFFDGRSSADGTRSVQDLSRTRPCFTDGRPTSIGINGGATRADHSERALRAALLPL